MEKTLLLKDGKRVDGRALDELRPLSLKVGILNRADGSAYIEHGNNKIVAAVYGPRELHPKHLALPNRVRVRVEYRLATFSVGERKSPAPRRREHELSKIIQEALESSILVEKFPRSTIDIFIQVLDADGGTRCASITAASLALADAGIPLRSLVAAVAAGKVEGNVVLDLCDIEDKEGEGDLPVAIMEHNQEITLLQLDGNFSIEDVLNGIKMAKKACSHIHELQKNALLSKYRETADNIQDSEEGIGADQKDVEESIVEEPIDEQNLKGEIEAEEKNHEF